MFFFEFIVGLAYENIKLSLIVLELIRIRLLNLYAEVVKKICIFLKKL